MGCKSLFLILVSPKIARESSSYLVPGIKEHDIISGQVGLSEVPWYLLNLTDRIGVNSVIFFFVFFNEFILNMKI